VRLVVRHDKLAVTACAYLAEVEARVTVAFQARSWDCVVVGGGVLEDGGWQKRETSKQRKISLFGMNTPHGKRGGESHKLRR
jgi:hypothetical protein